MADYFAGNSSVDIEQHLKSKRRFQFVLNYGMHIRTSKPSGLTELEECLSSRKQQSRKSSESHDIEERKGRADQTKIQVDS
jgi:hypothetical protein